MIGSTVTIDQSTLSNNHAGDGGGIYMESPTGDSTLKIYNSTIADNTALDEGAGIFRQGHIDIRNSTIARNMAETSGGGVETDGTGWTLQLKNSAILGNTANGAASDWANGLAGELAANSVSSLVGLAGKTLGDYFSPSTLADNGGPTKTLKPKLVAGNALIDGGNATVCASAPISGKDQRGFGRLNPCDIGAVDVDRTKPVVSGVKISLRQGQTLSGSSSRGQLTWSASDSGSGLKQYTVQRRVDGGSWSTLATGLTSKSFNVTLSRTHDYRFRVRAIDKEGNVGTFANGATFEARLYQQTSSAFAYGGSVGDLDRGRVLRRLDEAELDLRLLGPVHGDGTVLRLDHDNRPDPRHCQDLREWHVRRGDRLEHRGDDVPCPGVDPDVLVQRDEDDPDRRSAARASGWTSTRSRSFARERSAVALAGRRARRHGPRARREAGRRPHPVLIRSPGERYPRRWSCAPRNRPTSRGNPPVSPRNPASRCQMLTRRAFDTTLGV